MFSVYVDFELNFKYRDILKRLKKKTSINMVFNIINSIQFWKNKICII